MKQLTALIIIGAVAACITTAASGDDSLQNVANRFEVQTLKYTGGPYHDHVFKYRVLKPAKIEKGKKYPLVLFLHGAGERGDDNMVQLKYLPTWISTPEMQKKYPCFLIAPQCPKDRMWIDAAWTQKSQTTSDEPTAEMQAAIDMLKKAEAEYPIDMDRVYLTGLSMGGFGTWDLACRHPDWFAAVAPIAGGGDETKAAKLVGVPVWAWHGGADPVVSVERTRHMIEAIKKAGGHPKYTELPGVGHNSWTAAYTRKDGLIPWMFAQKRGQ